MKYVVGYGGRELRLDVVPDGDGRFKLLCDGRTMLADLAPAGGRSLWSLVLDREAFEVAVVRQKDQCAVTLRGQALVLRVESEQARNARLVERAGGTHGPHTVMSVMPGRVVRVLVREGEGVGPGTPLLILEAMKMENEIRSVSAGTVARVLVSAGQTVGNGDPLVVIGPEESSGI
jgi:biotin carboxyl carrier protein